MCTTALITSNYSCDDDVSTPVYSHEAPKLFVESAVEMIFDTPSSKICSKQPINVVHSTTFVIDTSKLDHKDDVRSDDLGTWKNGGVKSQYCSVTFSDVGRVKRVIKLPSKPSVMRSSIYRIKRSYWHHTDDKDFCRRLIELEGNVHACM